MREGEEFVAPADGGLALLLAAPFTPGEAPFRIKGNAYRGHMDYVEANVPGGLRAQAAALRALSRERGEALATFFDQPFLAAAWYDVYPLAIAGAACGRVTGQPFLDFVATRARAQARADIGGLYRFLLRFVSAKSIGLRTPGLMSRYFDFLRVETELLDDKSVRTIFSGVPVALAPWFGTAIEHYIMTAIEIATDTAPAAGDVSPAIVTGTVHGVPVCEGSGLLRLA